ncbi:hypothetical protein [Uruburuella suis]|uniref:hypothetical protein n=1 Tax=Uruburuella suis TaxID=252130 RepID=UPI003F4AAC4D
MSGYDVSMRREKNVILIQFRCQDEEFAVCLPAGLADSTGRLKKIQIKNKKIGGFSGKAAQAVLPNKVILGIIRASLPV